MSSRESTPTGFGSNGPDRNINTPSGDRLPSSSPPPSSSASSSSVSTPTFAPSEAGSLPSSRSFADALAYLAAQSGANQATVRLSADALAYMAARVSATQATRSSADDVDRGPTYAEAHGDTHGANAATAMGSDWPSHSPPNSDPNGRGRTTWVNGPYRSYGPPGTVADMTTTARRQGQNPTGMPHSRWREDTPETTQRPDLTSTEQQTDSGVYDGRQNGGSGYIRSGSQYSSGSEDSSGH
ncbi:hypothetical protein CTA2_7193 [Colletotrichum tanaceti]|uniref:Uncharacterized protein n=1 Tax=Colletotrichum tanaceti TaxID=1306861 RepID=A0A4U6X5G3_9PEZI|nr:hypothetical protein CTA2_7193 [Colletotrichum tanaceti]TKW50672.1 hypothetical protein CTA1_10362 [Colletotrichum tanaceti]